MMTVALRVLSSLIRILIIWELTLFQLETDGQRQVLIAIATPSCFG